MLQKAINFSGLAFLFLIVVVPYSYYELKIPIGLVYLLNLIGVIFYQRKFRIHKFILVFTIVNVSQGVFFNCYSYLNGSMEPEAWIYTGSLYCAFPLIYLLLIISTSSNLKSVLYIERVLIMSSFFISLYFILYYLSIANIIGIEIPKLDNKQNISISEYGIPEIKSSAISSLTFLIPYLISKVLIKEHSEKSFNYFLLILVLIINILSIFLTGRRALQINSLFFYFFSILSIYILNKLFFYHRLASKLKFHFIVIGFMIFGLLNLFLWFEIDFLDFLDTIFSAFDFSNDESNLERKYQFQSLFNQVIQSPIFGYGHGVKSSIIRDFEKPWRYELSYLDVLFHTGLIGFVIYAVSILWIIRNLIHIFKHSSELFFKERAFSSFIGLLSIMISYISNPYLNAFDILWVLFYPIFIINVYFLNVNKQ